MTLILFYIQLIGSSGAALNDVLLDGRELTVASVFVINYNDINTMFIPVNIFLKWKLNYCRIRWPKYQMPPY